MTRLAWPCRLYKRGSGNQLEFHFADRDGQFANLLHGQRREIAGC